MARADFLGFRFCSFVTKDGYAVQVGWSEARLCLWLWKDCLTRVGRSLLLNCKGLPRLNLSVVPSCPAGSGLRKVLRPRGPEVEIAHLRLHQRPEELLSLLQHVWLHQRRFLQVG